MRRAELELGGGRLRCFISRNDCCKANTENLCGPLCCKPEKARRVAGAAFGASLF